MANNYTLPAVHLNGTSRKMLAEGYQSAYSKLIEFRDAFHSIEFNPRDYYVKSNTAFADARADRDIMEHKIGSLMKYLDAHLIHLGE